MSHQIKGNPYRVKVLSNVTVNSIKELLDYVLYANQINPSVEIGNYDNIVQDSSKCEDVVTVIIIFDVLNIVDGIQEFFEDLSDEMYNSIKFKILSEIDIVFKNLNSTPTVIFNLFSASGFVSSSFGVTKLELLVSELNGYLYEIKPLNVTLVNIDKVIAQIGVNQSYDLRMYHSSKAPYTLAFLKKYLSSIEPIILKNTGKLKKAIIFDCDNTLWNGILGEDGIDKIEMSCRTHNGHVFNTIQQIAVYLSRQGVIVGLCSKNNEQDVNEVINNHPDVVLKDKYITVKKINWIDKATNLKSIATELNIGLDSIVFVDDSSFEINLINEQLPEIVTLQVPKAIYEYQNFILNAVYKYFNLSVKNIDSNKTELYKQQFIRESNKSKFATIDEYLSSLEISLSIDIDKKSQVQRIAELTQKTNQFNLTTIRYTENQIQNYIESLNTGVLTLSAQDKFGDNGITGLCLIKQDTQNANNALIDVFLMSCRIIGRNIEFAFMDFIIDYLIGNKYESVSALYVPTKKNAQVDNFYDGLGYNLLSTDNDSKLYTLNLSEYKKKNIEYIKLTTHK